MNCKKICIIGLLILFCALNRAAFLRVDAYRDGYTYRLQTTNVLMPIGMIKVLAGEFRGMVANYFVLEAASFNGSEQAANASTEDWNAIANLLEKSSDLDPYFKSTYRLAQSTLPWQVQKYEETFSILERSKRHRDWDWEPGFFKGFNYHFFLRDDLSASREMLEASKVEGAPVMLATLGSRLASKAGQTRAAIEFLSALYEEAQDEQIKATLQERIEALKGVEILQAAVDRFQKRYDRWPDTLDELVEKTILMALPNNPYQRPYSLKEGTVDF